MSNRVISNIVVENARISAKNFSGRPDRYNDEGNRHFSLVINDPEMIDRLLNDGWNLKVREPRNEEESVRAFLDVKVRFDKYPPRVFIIENGCKVQLNADQIGILDNAEIENIDLTVSPSFWDDNGRSRIKAYLRTMFVTLRMDELDKKYLDMPVRASE